MILINFSHPLTETQRDHIVRLTGAVEPVRVIDAPAQFDDQQLFAPQAAAMIADLGLSPHEWQTKQILIVPPALNFIAAVVLAELHGRMGYFPPIVRMRPVAGSMPRTFEVAELLDLQGIREQARLSR